MSLRAVVREAAGGGGGGTVTGGNNGIYMNGTELYLGVNPLIENTVIDTAAFELRFTSAKAFALGSATAEFFNTGAGNAVEMTAVGGRTLFAKSTGTGVAVFGEAISGVGVQANATTGTGLQAFTTSGMVGRFSQFNVSTATVEPLIEIVRLSSGNAANNIGASIQFIIQTDNVGTPGTDISTTLVSQWTDAADATRKSKFYLTGVHNGITSNLFEIASTGQIRGNKYGIGTFVAAPVFGIGVDINGNLVEYTPAAGTLTAAGNGLYVSGSTVRLGGNALIENTVIDAGTLYNLSITANSFFDALFVNQLGLGAGIKSISISGVGVWGDSDSNSGVSASSNTGTALYVTSVSGEGAEMQTFNGNAALRLSMQTTAAASTEKIMTWTRTTSGFASNGIGLYFDVAIETSTGSTEVAHEIKFSWSDATAASRRSELIITGVDAAVTADILTLSGTGQLRLNKYGVSTFTGTPATYSAWDSSGNMIEVTAVGIMTANEGLSASAGNVVLGGSSFTSSKTITTGVPNFLRFTNINGNVDIYGNKQEITNTDLATIALNISAANLPVRVTWAGTGTNDVTTGMHFQRTTSGVAANNFGIQLVFSLEASDGNVYDNTIIQARWNDATVGSRKSELVLSGITAAGVLTDRWTLFGDGRIRHHVYGLNNITGTPATYAAWDVSGNLIETPPSAAGGDLALSKLAPASNFTVTAGYSAYVGDEFEIIDPVEIEIGAGGNLELG